MYLWQPLGAPSHLTVQDQPPIELTAEVCSLSDIIYEQQLSRIDLLKIDCEGDELAVLLGVREEHWALIAQVEFIGVFVFNLTVVTEVYVDGVFSTL